MKKVINACVKPSMTDFGIEFSTPAIKLKAFPIPLIKVSSVGDTIGVIPLMKLMSP